MCNNWKEMLGGLIEKLGKYSFHSLCPLPYVGRRMHVKSIPIFWERERERDHSKYWSNMVGGIFQFFGFIQGDEGYHTVVFIIDLDLKSLW